MLFFSWFQQEKIRSVAQEFAQVAKNKPVIIHASKGLEQDTIYKRILVLIEEIPEDRQGVVVLSIAMQVSAVPRTTPLSPKKTKNSGTKSRSEHLCDSYESRCIGAEMGRH